MLCHHYTSLQHVSARSVSKHGLEAQLLLFSRRPDTQNKSDQAVVQVASLLAGKHLKIQEAIVHDALQQFISGSIAGRTHQNARLASQIRQCTAQPSFCTCLHTLVTILPAGMHLPCNALVLNCVGLTHTWRIALPPLEAAYMMTR